MVFSDPGLLSRRVEGNTVPYVQTPNSGAPTCYFLCSSEVRLLPSVDWGGTWHRFCCGVLDDKPLSGLEQQPPLTGRAFTEG